eukprot:3372379-Rhodomonas_salina.4
MSVQDAASQQRKPAGGDRTRKSSGFTFLSSFRAAESGSVWDVTVYASRNWLPAYTSSGVIGMPKIAEMIFGRSGSHAHGVSVLNTPKRMQREPEPAANWSRLVRTTSWR